MVKQNLLQIALLLVSVNVWAAAVDPTRPMSAIEEGAPVVASKKVSYIFVSKEQSFAIIDGQRVSVGDRVGNAEVVAIFPDGVKLEDGSTGEIEIAALFPIITHNQK